MDSVQFSICGVQGSAVVLMYQEATQAVSKPRTITSGIIPWKKSPSALILSQFAGQDEDHTSHLSEYRPEFAQEAPEAGLERQPWHLRRGFLPSSPVLLRRP